MQSIKTVKITSRELTSKKWNEIGRSIDCFKDSVNFLIVKCVENSIFQKISKKGNIYYNYASYPTIRKQFYHEWKSIHPSFHTHYCHSSARITKDVLVSWNSWCFKKKRRLPNPFYKKKSMKLEADLCYLEDNNIVLVTSPRKKVYIPFVPSTNYNRLRTELNGEITIKVNDDKTITAYVPFKQEIDEKSPRNVVGIDINERSVDVGIVKNDCIDFTSIDTSKISTTHYTYSLKRKTIAKNFDGNERYRASKRKELLCKYGKIERDITKNELHDLANQVRDIVVENDSVLVMENLTNVRQSSSREKNLQSWQESKSKRLRRRLNRWNFKQFQNYVDYKVRSAGYPVELVNPRNTSKTCVRCGKKTKCLSEIFTCHSCGFTMNRHLHATVNIVKKYLDNKHVASADPAEEFQMNVTSGEFCKLVETITGGTSQMDEIYLKSST